MSSTSLVSAQAGKLARLFDIPESGELLSVLKATAFKGPQGAMVSDAQMSALLIVAGQYKLNPWTKEIYAFPDPQNGIVPVVGVDGWSRIINEHPQFDGMEFNQVDDACTCIIYRKDRSRPTSVTEYLSECRRDSKPWKSHPKRMLRHKAMIQCSRLAFGFVGVFDPDEAEAIAEREINPQPQRAKPSAVKKSEPATQQGEVIDAEYRQEEAPPPQEASEPPAQESVNDGGAKASPGMISLIMKKMQAKNITEAMLREAFPIPESMSDLSLTTGNQILQWISGK